MSDGVNLGVASLGLEANLAQLRADLDDAKARVATSVAEMQAMLDRLHVGLDGGLLGAGLDRHAGAIGLWSAAQNAELASVRRSIEETDASYAGMATAAQVAADVQVAASGRVVAAYAAQAAAAKAAADAEEAAAGRSALARSILGGIGGHGALRDVGAASSDTAIWGVRGPTPHPFSATNPGTVVIAAADRTPLGSLAAAIGEDAQSGGPESLSVSTEQSNTRTVVGETPLAEQQRQKGAVPALIGLEAQRQQVMEGSLARALTALEAAQRPSAGKATTIAGITEEDQKVADATGSAVADALAVEAAKALPANLAPGQVAKGGSAYRAAYEALGYTVASRVAGGPPRLYAPGGEPGTGNYGLTTEAALLAAQKAEDAKAEADALAAFLGHPYGAGAVGVPGLGPRSGLSALGPDMTAAQAALYGPEKAAAATGGAGGSGGGGGVPPWLAALLWGHGGGGGGGGGTYGLGLAGRAFGGAMGIGAGIGSLGSFAGFGPEHIILTLGGIAGSGVAALGGGALLGAGALGKVAAGGGADALVGASAIADTKTLYTGYEKLREAVAAYGKGSEQADEAQKELNATMKGTLSGTPGVTAELHLAEKLSALNVQWDKQTSSARVAFVKLAEPLVEIGSKWIPLINRAATENFTSMRKSLQPFFEYLGGPEAMGIFEKLEGEFHEQIPTAMKLLDMSFQFLGKTIAAVAPLTGSLLTSLDNFFTKMDEPQHFAKWEEMMSHLIKDFHVWGAFIKELGGSLVDLFDKDAHTGEGIIETLTKMLHGVREWEKSTEGSGQLHNIFQVHKEEVIELLKALSELVKPFAEIYLTVSPPLVRAVTAITEGVAKMVLAFEQLGPGATWIVGLTLILAKLRLLVPLLREAGLATGLLAASETKVTEMSTVEASAMITDALAASGLAAAEGKAAGAGLGVGGASAVKGAAAEEAAPTAADAAELIGLPAFLAGGALKSSTPILSNAFASVKTAVSDALPALLSGAVASAITSMGLSAAGVHHTANTAVSLGVGVVAAGSMLGAPELAIPAGIATAGLIEALHALNKKAPEYGEQFAKAYYAPFAVILPKTVTEPLEEKLKKIRDEREKAEHPREALGSLTHFEEKIPLYGKLFTAGPSTETAKIMKDQEKEGANAFEAFKQGFRDSTQKSAFGFSLSAFQSLFDMSPVARQAAAKSMLAWAAELVKNKELPVNALGEIIHRLEKYFPELTAFFQTQGAASSKALTTALNLQQAQTNTQHALKVIDEAFGAAKLTIPQALESIDYAIAHSAGKEKQLWEGKRYAVQHALYEEEKALKASTAAQLESMHHLASGLKTGATSWETYAVAVEHWSKKLTERVGGGIESLGQGIKTINAMLETELSELGAPKEIRTALVTGKGGVNLRENPTTGTAGKGPLVEHAQGGLLQIGQPGEAGHDTVGLNVGGLPIAVGAGEQVAVFNRHQQPIVNAALEHMGYGGLPGLFGAVTTPNYMAAGGLIPDVVQAGLSDVRKDAKAKLAHASSLAGTYGGQGGKGSGGSPSANERLGREMMIAAGFPASEWPYLQKLWTKESGWSDTAENQPGAGWLADGNASGIPQSDGHGNVYPKGDARAQIAWGLNYLKSTWHGNIQAAYLHDLAHLSYSTGGLLGFAGGGIVPPGVTGHHPQPLSGSGHQVSANFGHGAKKNPKGAKPPHHYSGPLTFPWNPSENKSLYELGVLLETTIPVAQESYGNLGSQYSLNEYGSGSLAFVITEGPLGEAITPHEDPSNVQGRLGQLHALFGAESDYRGLLISAQERLGGINTWIAAQMNERHKQIKKLQERIQKIRAQIEANLKKLAELEKAREAARTKNKAAIHALEGQIETAENATHPNHAHITSLHAQLRVLRGEENAGGLDKQIKALRADNKRLSGDETAIGSHGELGPLETSRDTLQSQLSTLGERRSTLTGDLQGIQGIGGAGGSLAETANTLAGLNKQIAELSPESLAVQVARAVAQSGGSSTGESPLELAEREKGQLEEKLKISKQETLIKQQALSVFGGSGDISTGGINAYAAAGARGMLIPASWVPSFDVGGVVPGVRGAPSLALVHGQEEILTPEQREQRGGVHQHDHWEINTLHPADPATLTAIGKAATRGQRLQGNRLAKRLVPGI